MHFKLSRVDKVYRLNGVDIFKTYCNGIALKCVKAYRSFLVCFERSPRSFSNREDGLLLLSAIW